MFGLRRGSLRLIHQAGISSLDAHAAAANAMVYALHAAMIQLDT